MLIKCFHDFKPNELYAIFRHIYITSEFMSDDFDLKFPDIKSFQNYYLDVLKRPGAAILVAINDDKPAGYLVLEPATAKYLQHTAWLNMGIAEQFRRQGIGMKLVESACERAAYEKIIEIIYLMVRADNIPAIKLYLKTGFETIARLERDTKIGNDYYDGLLMRKFITHV